MISVGVNNTCGQSGSYATRYTTVSGCYYLSISPNPGSNEVSVTIQEPQTNEVESTDGILPMATPSNKPVVYNFIITDNMGVVYSTFTKKSKFFTLSVQNLKNGNYILLGTDGITKFSTPLIVMH
jgi:hypothetical protein